MPTNNNLLELFNLKKPYPLNVSIKKRWWRCVAFSSFVFLFLLIFKPFEINRLPNDIFLTAIGYGIICFVIMALLNVAVFSTFPAYFSENGWTSKKEISWILLNISLIGLGNFFYSILIGMASFSFHNLLWFEVYTLAIGVFPVASTILVNQARLNNQFENESQKINTIISSAKVTTEITETEAVTFTIFSENGIDELKLLPQDLLFVKAADNYVEIFYLNKGLITRKLIRNSLKNISNLLLDNANFIRCHKSYIVNLKQVIHISGNAQGYKLHITGTDNLVPVSRINNAAIQQYFTNRP